MELGQMVADEGLIIRCVPTNYQMLARSESFEWLGLGNHEEIEQYSMKVHFNLDQSVQCHDFSLVDVLN